MVVERWNFIPGIGHTSYVTAAALLRILMRFSRAAELQSEFKYAGNV